MKSGRMLALGAALCILAGCSSNQGTAAASEKPVINNLKTLTEALQEALQAGEETYTFTTEQLEQEDLMSVNEEMDSFYGSVSTCQTEEDVLGNLTVTYDLEVSTNAYVELYYKENQEIPDQQEEAKKLQETCERIIKHRLKNKDTSYQKEKAIHDYIVEKTVYGYPDDNRESGSDAYTAYGALVRGMAVCNGYAESFKLLCDISGISCKMVTGESHGENHAWNMVCLEDDAWYQVDVTWDDPSPDVKGRILYNYFNITDQQMAVDHTWNQEDLPQAEATEYNYYNLNDLNCEDYEAFKEKCAELLEDDTPESLQFCVRDYDKSLYNNESLQFFFDYDIKNVNFQVAGQKPYTTLYLKFSY